MTTIRNRSIAVLGAIVATFATVSAAAPAHAETVTGSMTTVRYADLDLASPAGAAKLHHRIQAAAARVCGPQELTLRFAIARCRQEAIARADASIAAARRATMLAQR